MELDIKLRCVFLFSFNKFLMTNYYIGIYDKVFPYDHELLNIMVIRCDNQDR